MKGFLTTSLHCAGPWGVCMCTEPVNQEAQRTKMDVCQQTSSSYIFVGDDNVWEWAPPPSTSAPSPWWWEDTCLTSMYNNFTPYDVISGQIGSHYKYSRLLYTIGQIGSHYKYCRLLYTITPSTQHTYFTDVSFTTFSRRPNFLFHKFWRPTS